MKKMSSRVEKRTTIDTPLTLKAMATDGMPARKMRRTVADEDDEDEDHKMSEDVTEPAGDNERRAATPQLAQGNSDDDSEGGLFSDAGDESGEDKGSPSNKRAREEDEDSELGDVGSIGPDEAEFLEDDLEGEPIRQLIVADHSLPSIPNPAPSDGKMYHLELPKILHLAPYPFDPAVPLPGPESEDFMHPLSTIRHRKTPEGPRSNARFLKWSDGSMSLVLGAEMYDIPLHQVTKSEQQFLVMSHHEAGLLRVVKRVDATMKVVPMSTSSEAHRRLVTKQMGGRGTPIEKRGTKEFQPDGDPEALKKMAEKALEDKIRSRKKLESKRKATTIRYGGLGMKSERLDEDGDEPAQVGVGRYDDEGDGFVVSDDDEEEEEKAGRLSRIKSQGTQKYRDRKRQDSEDEDDLDLDDESVDDEEDEKVASSPLGKKQQDTPRKSRRRIVDDEDED